MRILLARSAAAITALLIVVMAVFHARMRSVPRDPEQDAPNEVVAAPEVPLHSRGRAVYLEQRCGRCHSIRGEGDGPHPLDGVGRRLDERGIRLWITAPDRMKPGVAKRPYLLPPDDLDALVAYLMSLTGPDADR
jgi:mono/diheme cytochrome c family protein